MQPDSNDDADVPDSVASTCTVEFAWIQAFGEMGGVEHETEEVAQN